MKMTFTKSAFEMPDGKYMARFVGTTLREPTGQLDQRGNPMPAGMTWDFEIVEPGENYGKKTDRLTGRQPTAKSACGKILAAITDAVLKDGQEVDLASCYGKYYRVTVVENRVSDSPAPVLVSGYTPASGPVAAAAQAQTGGPAAPPSAQSAAPSNRKFWFDLGGGKTEEFMEESALNFLTTKGVNADTAMVCAEGGTWKKASEYGLKTAF